MIGDYDSDDGDQVTYRHNEIGLGLRKRLQTDDFGKSLWSKRNRSSADSLAMDGGDDGGFSILRHSSFVDADDTEVVAGSGEFVAEPRRQLSGITQTVNSSAQAPKDSKIPLNAVAALNAVGRVLKLKLRCLEILRDAAPSKTQRNGMDIDIPVHWAAVSSRPSQRPPASKIVGRLQAPQRTVTTLPTTRSTTFVATSLMAPPRSTAGGASRAMNPSRPAWLPGLSMVSQPNRTNSNTFSRGPSAIEEDIVDESFAAPPQETGRRQMSPRNIDRCDDYDHNIEDGDDRGSNIQQSSSYRESSVQQQQSPPKRREILPSSGHNIHHTNSHSSPAKKQRSTGPKIGSLRWKFEKLVRDTSSVDTFLSSPEIAQSMHDPRSRLGIHLPARLVAILGPVMPFVAIKVFINTLDQDTGDKTKPPPSTKPFFDQISGIYHAIALVRPNGVQERKLNAWDGTVMTIVMYDPAVIQVSQLSPARHPLLCAHAIKGDDGVQFEYIFVSSTWEVCV